MPSAPERVLVLCVDRDGDLERKTGIRSPVYGREAVLSAATRLAVADPEEADANALFAATKELDSLRAQEIECEVGAVCGLRDSGFKADRKIRSEVETLLSKQAFSGIVLISDGAEDELVVPILQTLKPVVSVRRVVVKHSRSVEENYMVIGRYLRMLVFDPRYSKWAIGVPGVIFLFVGFLSLAGAAYLATLSILLILGATLLIRGFNIDRFVAGMLSQKPHGYIRLFSIPASILIFIVALSSGYSSMTENASQSMTLVTGSPSLFFQYAGQLIGFYLKGSILLIWAAIGIVLAGNLLTQLLRGSSRVWRSLTMIVVLTLLFFPMDQFSDYLITGGTNSSILLITYVLVGLAAVFGVVITVYTRLRSRSTSVPSVAAPNPGIPTRETTDGDEQEPHEERQD